MSGFHPRQTWKNSGINEIATFYYNIYCLLSRYKEWVYAFLYDKCQSRLIFDFLSGLDESFRSTSTFKKLLNPNKLLNLNWLFYLYRVNKEKALTDLHLQLLKGHLDACPFRMTCVPWPSHLRQKSVRLALACRRAAAATAAVGCAPCAVSAY